MKTQVSIKEIARICGVSVATVSRIINQNGRYSEETEKRVRKVIKELNYQPNQIAKGLRTSRTDIIGIIVPDITNEYFAALILAFQKKLFQGGYSCVIFNTDGSREIERQCLNNLAALNISGIISVNGYLDLNELLKRDMPVVYIDKDVPVNNMFKNWATLSSDHETGAYLATKELATRGCKRILCITALPDSHATHLRTEGFIRACTDYQINCDSNHIFVPQSLSVSCGYEIIKKALEDRINFDGVFCQTDWLAVGALNALIEFGIQVPEDVKLVGFDDIRVTQFTQKPLTTIHQSTDSLGATAANIMLQMQEGIFLEERNIKLPVQLIRRETT